MDARDRFTQAWESGDPIEMARAAGRLPRAPYQRTAADEARAALRQAGDACSRYHWAEAAKGRAPESIKADAAYQALAAARDEAAAQEQAATQAERAAAEARREQERQQGIAEDRRCIRCGGRVEAEHQGLRPLCAECQLSM